MCPSEHRAGIGMLSVFFTESCVCCHSEAKAAAVRERRKQMEKERKRREKTVRDEQEAALAEKNRLLSELEKRDAEFADVWAAREAALRDRKTAFVKHQLSRVERLKHEKAAAAQRIEADRQKAAEKLASTEAQHVKRVQKYQKAIVQRNKAHSEIVQQKLQSARTAQAKEREELTKREEQARFEASQVSELLRRAASSHVI